MWGATLLGAPQQMDRFSAAAGGESGVGDHVAAGAGAVSRSPAVRDAAGRRLRTELTRALERPAAASPGDRDWVEP
ncbi:hypothetical protein GCM10010221_51090 [Streptomyces parvus]|nr:hypothetical protein GCM10010221_51090 [Streptomyces parvus]